jgi:ABC-type amino acid transport substrate-binding protein
MKKFLLSLLLLTLSFPAFADDAKESAFDRIMRTGVIRCGYYVFPPVTYRDPNTGILSGLTVDTMNYIAERASLKVEWTEEVTFGNWVPALQAKRVDAICTPMWPELPMARAAAFSEPMFFAGLYPVVRADDVRFAKGVTRERFNQPDVTFVSQEGNITSILTKAAFPNAKHYVLSPEADTTSLVMSVVNKKADVQLADYNAVNQWNEHNESKIKIIDQIAPIKVQQFPFSVGRGEYDLLAFLNLAVKEMHYNGEMDRILRKWEPEPGKTFLRVAPPVKAN